MAVDSLAENRKRLLQFLDAEIDSLTGILRVYMLRAGLSADEDAIGELLNSVVVEALSHAGRYDPARPPRAWLLGIAANLVRRRQAEQIHLDQRELSASDLPGADRAGLGEDELFDLLAAHAPGADGPNFQTEAEQRDHLEDALALLSVDERRVIRLFASCSLDGDAMAAALHVTPGTARVRLHRVLARLRRVWQFAGEKKAHD